MPLLKKLKRKKIPQVIINFYFQKNLVLKIFRRLSMITHKPLDDKSTGAELKMVYEIFAKGREFGMKFDIFRKTIAVTFRNFNDFKISIWTDEALTKGIESFNAFAHLF